MYYFKRRKRVMKEFQKCCEKNAQQAQRAGLMVKDYSEVEKCLNILLMMVDRCWGDLEGIKNELEEIFYDNETGELDEAKFTDSSDLSENAYDEIEECIHDISPKAIAKNLGHSTEIVTVDNYIDKSKLSVIKLDKLDSFIDSVVPKTNCEEEDKDFSKVIIDVSEFF